MVTKQYILMCEMAEEIQKAWKQNLGDIYIYKKYIGSNNLTFYVTEYKKYINAIYLPTLEQLFEKWCNLCNTKSNAHIEYLAGDHLPTLFIGRLYREIIGRNKWFSKELCLQIIMTDFYNKIWTGENWEGMK